MSLGWMKAALRSPRWVLGALLMGLGVSIIGAKLLGQDNFRSPSDPRYDRTDPRYNNNNTDPRYRNDRIAREDPRYRNDGGRENVDDLLRPLMQNEFDRRDSKPLVRSLGEQHASRSAPDQLEFPHPANAGSPAGAGECLPRCGPACDVAQQMTCGGCPACVLIWMMCCVCGRGWRRLADRSRQYNDHQHILPGLERPRPRLAAVVLSLGPTAGPRQPHDQPNSTD